MRWERWAGLHSARTLRGLVSLLLLILSSPSLDGPSGLGNFSTFQSLLLGYKASSLGGGGFNLSNEPPP